MTSNPSKAVLLAIAVLVSAACGQFARAAFAPGEFISHSQWTWDGNPTISGSPAELLYQKFFLVYSGDVEVGLNGAAGFSMVFTSGQAILNYLPQGFADAPLNADFVDPTSTGAGIFGGNVLALQLDIDFADAGFLTGSANIPFGDLILVNMTNASDGSHTFNLSAFEGWTVRQLLDEASMTLSTGLTLYSYSAMSYAVEFVTQSFEGGQPSQFAQNHLRVVPEPTAGKFALLALLGLMAHRIGRTPC